MLRLQKNHFIIKVILSTITILMMTACGGGQPTYKTYKELSAKKAPKKIKLYKQEFDMPAPVSVSVKLYPSTHLKGNMGFSWYRFNNTDRTINYDSFCFSKTKSRRFPTPYYALKFPYPLIVSNVLVYHNELAFNDKKQRVEISPNLYRIKDSETMKNPYLFSYEETNNFEKYQDKKTKLRVDSLNLDSKKSLNQIFLTFDDLEAVSYTRYIDVKKKPTVKVEGYSVEKVVFHALRTRNDKIYNEALVREISLKNKNLFRKIQRNVKSFKLPKKSIARVSRKRVIKKRRTKQTVTTTYIKKTIYLDLSGD